MSEPIPGKDENVPQESKEGDEKEPKEKTEGEKVKEGLELLEKIGVKDDIEKGIQKIDHDTPAEVAKESSLITERMNKLDVLITVGLYYTSLVMDWLTLLGESPSVKEFFFNLFLESFNVADWDFSEGDLSLVARISGMTTTLQTGIFTVSGMINLGARMLNKPVPNIVGGPMYYGGPFQIIYVLMPKAKDYTDSIKSLDAQISQWMGFFSQVLVIIAASFAAANRVKALDPFTQGDESLIGHGYSPEPNSEDQFGQTISPGNATQVALSVQHAALFAKATYIVTVVAIIMTSLLNIIQWLADVWRVNRDDLITYTIFKLLTRILLCQPCLGDKWLSGVPDAKGGEKGGKGGKGENFSMKSPLKSSPLKESTSEKITGSSNPS